MSPRYVLAPEAALDLVQIWRFIKTQSTVAVADRVESVIRNKIAFLARTPGAGHRNKELTDRAVKFFSVYSTGQRQSHYRSFPFCMATGTWNRSSRVACNQAWFTDNGFVIPTRPSQRQA